MTQAFIVRPFGTKEGIDFDRVEAELIRPALESLGISGGTTGEIVAQGNIRTDMFQRLLTADLVVADLSIHNANVFYELGIRHALRDRHTVLIRHRHHAVPFDLSTDRYMPYDAERPAESVGPLVEALRASMRSIDRDSPVFQLLPDLQPADPEALLVVPPDFREEVEAALRGRRRGDLRRLAAETETLEWRLAGLRLVGLAQVELRDFAAARLTWEAVRDYDPNDRQANLKLATIHQKTGDLVASSQAVDRALADPGLTSWDRAEARALQGSNEKKLWQNDWVDVEDAPERQRAALSSPHLERSLESYADGFGEDRNHYYSGINALAMVTVTTELAKAHADLWPQLFASDEEAAETSRRHRDERRRLVPAVELALASGLARVSRPQHEGWTEDTATWIRVSGADLAALTQDLPGRAAHAYRRALAGCADFVWSAARSQLQMLAALGVRSDNARAALKMIDDKRPGDDSQTHATTPRRVLLFTGHRIDAAGREEPRFPPDAEPLARRMIAEAVDGEVRRAEQDGRRLLGIAGGASGGDLLFHEICEELGIPTRLYLALPRADYVRASVADAAGDGDWVARFDRLHRKLDTLVLNDTGDLPRWLQERDDYGIWQRSNLWMLYDALAKGHGDMTLIALWNGATGDGPGGTEDMVERAKEEGARTVLLDARRLVDKPE